MSTNIQPPPRTPLGTELIAEPGVAAWWASVRPLTDKLTAVPNELHDIINAFWEKRGQIRGNLSLSQTGQNEAIAELERSTVSTIESLYAAAKAAMDKLDMSLTGTVAPVPLGTQEALLLEMQTTRAWQRTKSALDRAEGAGTVNGKVIEIAEAASRDPNASGRPTLRALREELPSYLENRGMATILDVTMTRVAQIEAQFWPPVQRAALQLSQVTDGGWARLTMSFDLTRRSVNGMGEKPSFLPGLYHLDKLLK